MNETFHLKITEYSRINFGKLKFYYSFTYAIRIITAIIYTKELINYYTYTLRNILTSIYVLSLILFSIFQDWKPGRGYMFIISVFYCHFRLINQFFKKLINQSKMAIENTYNNKMLFCITFKII